MKGDVLEFIQNPSAATTTFDSIPHAYYSLDLDLDPQMLAKKNSISISDIFVRATVKTLDFVPGGTSVKMKYS